MKKYVECKLESEVFEILKLWNEKRKVNRKEGKNQLTGNPLYIVQKQYWSNATSDHFEKEELAIDCETYISMEEIKEGYFDDVVEYENEHLVDEDIEDIKNDIKGCFDFEEVIETLKRYSIETDELEIVYWIENWEDVAYFFTHEEAEEYRNYQAHNLKESRIYVASTGYDNRGSLTKLMQIIDYNNIFEGAENER